MLRKLSCITRNSQARYSLYLSNILIRRLINKLLLRKLSRYSSLTMTGGSMCYNKQEIGLMHRYNKMLLDRGELRNKSTLSHRKSKLKYQCRHLKMQSVQLQRTANRNCRSHTLPRINFNLRRKSRFSNYLLRMTIHSVISWSLFRVNLLILTTCRHFQQKDLPQCIQVSLAIKVLPILK